MIPTKRKMKRKELIDRVQALEYVLSNVINNARNLELVIEKNIGQSVLYTY